MTDSHPEDAFLCTNGHRSLQRVARTWGHQLLWCPKCGADLQAEPKPAEKIGRDTRKKADEPAALHVVETP